MTTTLQSLVISKFTGCKPATRLILKYYRDTWEWGDSPRSHATYTSCQIFLEIFPSL